MKKSIIRSLVIILIVHAIPIQSFIIDRVILTSDANPTYLQFWPLVAKAWKQIIGIQPTLFLISDADLDIDTTIGDVIRVPRIPGISSANQAQVMRLLAPLYFEDEICLISDIDMLPLNRDYFVNSVADIPDDMFVVYRNKAYGNSERFPMCYNAGKGYLFKSIFNIESIAEIPTRIKAWIDWWVSTGGTAWDTDEVILFTHVRKWNRFKTNCVFLHHDSMMPHRIDRACWQYDEQKLKQRYYIDAHMVRPLDKYYKEIKKLSDDLGLDWESSPTC